MSTLNTFSEDNFRAICDQLAAKDTDLRSVLDKHGYPPMWKRTNSFETLVHFVLEQQVSLASALAALNKLRSHLGSIHPDSILKMTDADMRSCYVSRQKMVYIRGMASAIADGSLNLSDLEQLPDDEVRRKLISLKGIGDWTADVYLMFVLQRADVFPVGDLAAVNALKRLKNLPQDVGKSVAIETAAAWSPYRTIASMILWHHYLSDPIKRGKVVVQTPPADH